MKVDSIYKLFLKRPFDFVLALIGFILFFPILFVVTIILFFVNEGKPFFVQVRPGKKERLFKIVKFRTMNDKRDAGGNLLPDSERLTGAGKFIRKTSLDEIPQLLNVIKGDMSLVGPRPLLIKYLPYYTSAEKKRFEVRPGITGWAQINGRNFARWDARLANDVYYVDHLSLLLDIKIILLTIKNIFLSKDIKIDPREFMLDFDQERKNEN